MFNPGLKKLTEPSFHPVPSWLTDPTVNGLPVGFALLAAVERINLRALVEGCTVYTGKGGNVSALQEAVFTTPANLSVRATPDGLLFSLNEVGASERGIAEIVEWELICAVQNNSLVLVIGDGRTIGRELRNEKLFIQLREAVLEAVQQPPRFHTVSNAQDASALLETVEIEEEHDVQFFSTPRSAVVSKAAVQAIYEMSNTVLTEQLQVRLHEEGSLPMWHEEGHQFRVEARSQTALRALSIVMSLAVGTDDEQLSDELLQAMGELFESPVDAPQASPSPTATMVSANSRFLPFRVQGISNTTRHNTVTASLWPCWSRVSKTTVGRGRKARELATSCRVGLNGIGHYTFGPSVASDSRGPSMPRHLNADQWGLFALNLDDTQPGLTDIFVSSISVTNRQEYMRGTDQLLFWLAVADTIFAPPLGQGGATITLVDRAG